ncbi:uncharacterized protein LOC121046466 [Ixodes scapularis]|uniref:uncharacterized protein LOC121046466 n=1 Tax=Ixodes scapularis TaxID=6945 RepID=UPI001C38E200|nr:uncharacterized protein LOC121046466 [Ixodes scapularis]
MERLKGKRGVKREQTTRLISEASAGLETADLATVTAWRERINACNQTLRSLNAEIEDQVPLEDLVAEYTTVSEYDDEATRVLAVLGCKIASLRQRELPTPTPLNETTSATASFSGAVHSNDSITRSEKFHYLRTLVTGPAAAAIAGLQATEACYDDAIHILTQRFGDRRRIEQDHLAKLRSLPPVASAKDTRGLRRIYDHVQTNIRGLRGLGVGSSTYCTMMSDILLRALPKEIVLDYHRWQSGNTAYRASGTSERDPTSPNATGQDAGRSIDSLSSARICPSPLQSADAEGELAEILGFLRVEVESRERAGVVAERYDPPRKTGIDGSGMPAAALLHTGITGQCFFCGSSKHSAELCTCDLKLDQKKRKLTEGSRCFRCTLGGHRARECRRKVSCAGCSGRHATSMCDPDWNPALRKPDRDAPLTSVQSAAADLLDSEVLLQTFRAWAVEGERRGYVRAIVDGGSQRTFIREDVSRKLGLKVLGETSLRLNTFGHCSTRPQRRQLVEVRLRSQYGQEECVVEAVEVPFICKDVVRVPADHVFVRRVEEDGRRIADALLFPGVPAEEGISLLVGSDQLWRVTGDQVLRCEENQKLVAISTIFGWTFQGPVSHHSSLSGNANSMVCVLRVGPAEKEDVGDVLRGFWELESIGIADRPCSKTEEHNEVLTEFNETIKKVDGRYEVGLPWKASTGNLKDNRTLALKRLGGLTKRLSRNESLSIEYDNAIGRRPTTLPSKSLDRIGESTKGELSRRWRHRQKVMDSFWRRWKKEYLLQLRSAHQSTETQINSLKDGDVVLVHEEKAPRIQWKVGRIASSENYFASQRANFERSHIFYKDNPNGCSGRAIWYVVISSKNEAM